jgi:hypothetical protein
MLFLSATKSALEIAKTESTKTAKAGRKAMIPLGSPREITLRSNDANPA